VIRALNVRPQWRLLPPETTEDAGVLLRARAVRAFGDGFVSVLLPLHLTTLGFGGIRIGAIATATLIGSAALTLLVGLIAYRIRRRVLLLRAAVLMVATGLGFAFGHDFWPLMLVAFVGTLYPSSGDVSVFLPTEQALLPQTVSARERTALFTRYSLIGSRTARRIYAILHDQQTTASVEIRTELSQAVMDALHPRPHGKILVTVQG